MSCTLFCPMHELLQDHYEGASKYAEKVAERLLAICVPADGRANTIVRTGGILNMPAVYRRCPSVIAPGSGFNARVTVIGTAGMALEPDASAEGRGRAGASMPRPNARCAALPDIDRQPTANDAPPR